MATPLKNSTAVLQDLVISRRNIIDKIEKAKNELKYTDGLIAEVVQPEQMLKAAGKVYGQTSSVVDGLKITVKADKKVKWDSELLMKIAQRMPWEQVAALFKITFEIPEAKYKIIADGIAPEGVNLSEIDAARTVEIGEAKVQSAEFAE